MLSKFDKLRRPYLVALVLLILELGIAADFAVAQEISQDIRAETQRSTVFIEVSFLDLNSDSPCIDGASGEVVKITGSGFIVSNRGFVLTAAHILEVPDECGGYTKPSIIGRISYRTIGTQIPMQILSSSSDFDVALLQLDPHDKPNVPIAVCDADSISGGADLLVFGFPLNEGFQGLPLIYQEPDTDKAYWVVSSDITHGYSGGPVVEMISGQVVGIAQGGLANTPAIRWVIPMRLANEQLHLAGIDSLENCVSPDANLPTAPLGDPDPSRFIVPEPLRELFPTDEFGHPGPTDELQLAILLDGASFSGDDGWGRVSFSSGFEGEWGNPVSGSSGLIRVFGIAGQNLPIVLAEWVSINGHGPLLMQFTNSDTVIVNWGQTWDQAYLSTSTWTAWQSMPVPVPD